MSNLTQLEIQEINRKIAAGTYKHVEDESPPPRVQRKKVAAKRVENEIEEAHSDE